MRLSVFFPYQVTELGQLRAAARLADRLGFHRLWTGNSLAIDTGLAFAALSRDVRRLAFGSAILVMQLRHPVQAAIEARSLAAMTDGRYALGLGVSERRVVEGGLGLPFRAPRDFAREYITVVKQAVADGMVAHHGEHFSVEAELPPLAPPCPAPPVLLAALSPEMARVAGEVADGAVTWLAPPEYLATAIVPAVRAGAVAAGREPPPVVALFPCAATGDERLALDVAELAVGMHVTRPHYSRMLRSAGILSNGAPTRVTRTLRDALLAWGGADAIGERIARYRRAGAAEVAVAAYLRGDEPAGLFERTLAAAAEAV